MVRVSLQKTVAGLESSKLTSVSSNKHIHNDLGGNPGNNKTFFDVDGLRNSLNPNTWRTWSIQRAGFSDASFEGVLFYVILFSFSQGTSIWWFHCLTD